MAEQVLIPSLVTGSSSVGRRTFCAGLQAVEHLVFHGEVDGFDESPGDGLAWAVGEALSHDQSGRGAVCVGS